MTISEGVILIGDYAFCCCSNLTSITIPDSVISIGWNTFQNCGNLTSVTIGEGVTIINGAAFYDCSSLWHVQYKGTQEQWNQIYISSYRNYDLTGATRHYNCTGEEEMDFVNKICSICVSNCTHEWDSGVVIKAETCTEAGEKLFTCPLCNGTQTEVIPAWGHNYDSVVTEPTCQAGGYTTHTCINCGDSYVDSYTDPLPYIAGDVDGNNVVDTDDAIYLLYYTLFGEESYPINQPCDYDGNGVVDTDDAIYLLYHTLFGEDMYPLN